MIVVRRNCPIAGCDWRYTVDAMHNSPAAAQQICDGELIAHIDDIHASGASSEAYRDPFYRELIPTRPRRADTTLGPTRQWALHLEATEWQSDLTVVDGEVA